MTMQNWLKKNMFLMLCLGLSLMLTNCKHKDSDSNSPTLPDQGQEVVTPPGWSLAIDDPLTDGTTKAMRGGDGWFTPGGYFINGDWDSYLLYETDIIRDIRVEFDARGYQPGEPMKGDDDQMAIILMQDAPPGTNWRVVWRFQRSSLFQFYKMADFDSTDGYKAKAGGLYYGVDEEWKTSWGDFTPVPWDPNYTYHWTIIIDDGDILIKRDEDVVLSDGTSFRPEDVYRVYIGGGDWQIASPNNVTYSNVKIYRKQ